MAKRRRLTPAAGLDLGDGGAFAEGCFARETSAAPERKLALPPIAGVAGDAARQGALEELSQTLEAARREGRLAETLPLASVVEDHLIRDRASVDESEMEGLMESLRQRGQQVPIEVVALGEGRYGLISGWRRLTALRRLAADGAGEGTVLAFLRRPNGDAEAYLAMVEENEMRADLGFWERGRIVARAVEAGVFEDRRQALNGLFGSVPRARRSKIGSFVGLVEALDGDLRYPEALSEKLGLALAKRLKDGAEAEVQGLRTALAEAEAKTPAEEATALSAWISGSRAKASVAPVPKTEKAATRPEVRVSRTGSGLRQRIVLSGPGVDQDLMVRIEKLLSQR